MANEDWPITGVVVVADISKCPAGYCVIDRTFDRSEEADLWRDGFFGRRVTRYLCVERGAPQAVSVIAGRDVLVDVSIINEQDPVPPGFTVVDYTFDTREKATKKKVMCVRWMSPSLTTSALSELIILPKNTRRPPNGYTLVGELNNLMLCYKMSNIKTESSLTSRKSDPSMNMSDVRSNLPYSINPNTAQENVSGNTVNNHRHHAPLERSLSSMSAIVSPLSGVPWQLSSRLTDLTTLRNIQIPEIRYKTLMDLENQYEYNFDVERSTRANNG